MDPPPIAQTNAIVDLGDGQLDVERTVFFVACTLCRKKKLRCSGIAPCERCVKAGAECVFVPSKRLPTTSTTGEDGKEAVGGGAAAAGEAGDTPSSSSTAATFSSLKKNNKTAKKKNDSKSGNEVKSVDNAGKTAAGKKSAKGKESFSSENSESGVLMTMRGKKQKSQQQQRVEYQQQEEYDLQTPHQEWQEEEQMLMQQQQVISGDLNKAFSSEILLADKSSAAFLMNIFTTRVLPYITQGHSLPDSSYFLNVVDAPNSYAGAMQRDGALALACRNCGHENLAKSLMDRIDQLADAVKSHELEEKSNESFCGYFLYFLLSTGGHVKRGFEVASSMLGLYQRICENNNATGDPLVIICGCMKSMNLEEDPLEDGISSVEIEAQVRHSAQQVLSLAATVEDARMKMFAIFLLELRVKMVHPRLRPAAAMTLHLTFDMQFLGLLIPTFLVELLGRHDPQNKLGMTAFCKPSVPLPPGMLPEPPDLPSEVAAALIRRCCVVRRLLYLSQLPAKTIIPNLVTIQSMEATLLMRSGDTRSAVAKIRWAINLPEEVDLIFWPADIHQSFFMMAALLYEAGDLEGVMKIKGMLQKLLRSHPAMQFATSALDELCNRLIDIQTAALTAALAQQQQQQQQQQHTSDIHLLLNVNNYYPGNNNSNVFLQQQQFVESGNDMNASWKRQRDQEGEEGEFLPSQ